MQQRGIGGRLEHGARRVSVIFHAAQHMARQQRAQATAVQPAQELGGDQRHELAVRAQKLQRALQEHRRQIDLRPERRRHARLACPLPQRRLTVRIARRVDALERGVHAVAAHPGRVGEDQIEAACRDGLAEARLIAERGRAGAKTRERVVQRLELTIERARSGVRFARRRAEQIRGLMVEGVATRRQARAGALTSA